MLTGKICLITGCNRGIGREMVNIFAKEGAEIYANARNEGSIDDYCAELSREYNTKVHPVYFDICDREKIKEKMEYIKENSGRLDVLINNAGISSNQLFEMLTRNEIERVFETNVYGTINMMQYAIKIMKKQKNGKIINISSCVGIDGNIGQAAYAASKGAINSITKSTAKEMALYGICINAVAPGLTQTEMLSTAEQEKLKDRVSRIMLGRLAVPEDIANCCAFLASEKADYITGQIIKVDGCMLM